MRIKLEKPTKFDLWRMQLPHRFLGTGDIDFDVYLIFRTVESEPTPDEIMELDRSSAAVRMAIAYPTIDDCPLCELLARRLGWEYNDERRWKKDLCLRCPARQEALGGVECNIVRAGLAGDKVIRGSRGMKGETIMRAWYGFKDMLEPVDTYIVRRTGKTALEIATGLAKRLEAAGD